MLSFLLLLLAFRLVGFPKTHFKTSGLSSSEEVHKAILLIATALMSSLCSSKNGKSTSWMYSCVITATSGFGEGVSNVLKYPSLQTHPRTRTILAPVPVEPPSPSPSVPLMYVSIQLPILDSVSPITLSPAKCQDLFPPRECLPELCVEFAALNTSLNSFWSLRN